MPWKPGQSGNPGGRKKMDAGVIEAARSHGVDAIEILWKIASDESSAVNSRVKACEILLNRGYGTPLQSVDIGLADGADLSLEVKLVKAPEA